MTKMTDKIYLHAINSSSVYNSYDTLEKLSKILASGALLSPRLQGKKIVNYSFAGDDYISLCDYEKRFFVQTEDNFYNAYYGYILNSLSLMFYKDSIKAVEPTIVGISNRNWSGYLKMQKLGNSEGTRYSDMPDEVQVKDCIALNKLVGVTFPTRLLRHGIFRCKNSANTIRKEILLIRKCLDYYGYSVPIYDIETLYEMECEENIEKILKKIR